LDEADTVLETVCLALGLLALKFHLMRIGRRLRWSSFLTSLYRSDKEERCGR
jgi:hypothetical protein